MHLFLLCVSDTWALVLGLYGRYFYIVDEQIATMLAAWEEEKELSTVKNISTLRKLPSKVTLSATDPECCC